MADSIIVANNSDAAFVEVDAIPVGYSNDGIFYKTVSGKHYKIANDGTIRAVKAGIKFDGTDKTSRINTVLAVADVHELIFDAYGESITVSGTVTVPAGKKLVFKNNCKLTGTGTIDGGIVDCDYLKQCFATTLTVINLENFKLSVSWFGAIADFDMMTNYSQTKTDNAPMFQAAVNAFKDSSALESYRFAGVLKIPRVPQGKAYYVGGETLIDISIVIEGDGLESSLVIAPP